MRLKLGLFDLDDCTQDPETLCIKNAALLLPIWLYMTSVGMPMAIVTNNISTGKNPCNTNPDSTKTRGDEIRDMFVLLRSMGIEFSDIISFFNEPLDVGAYIPDYAKNLSDRRAQNQAILSNGDGGKNLQIKDRMTHFKVTPQQTLFMDDNQGYVDAAEKITGLSTVKATTPNEGDTVDYLLKLARHVELDHYAEDLATAIKRKQYPQNDSIQKIMAGFLFILGFRPDLYSKDLKDFVEAKFSGDPTAKQQFTNIMSYIELRKITNKEDEETTTPIPAREIYLKRLEDYAPANKREIISYLRPTPSKKLSSSGLNLFGNRKSTTGTGSPVSLSSSGESSISNSSGAIPRQSVSAPARIPPAPPLRSDIDTAGQIIRKNNNQG